MFIIVSYDIAEDKRRIKVAKALEDYGARVQYSVFECLLNEQQFKKMKKAVLSLCNEKEDRVRFYILCQGCQKKIKNYGEGEVTEDEEVYIV